MLSEQLPTTRTTATNEEVTVKTDAEKVLEWISHPGEVTLHTHTNVDADAAFSAALMLVVREDATLKLLPADTRVDGKTLLAVDMMNGESAVKGIDEGSAFGQLVSILGDARVIPRRLFKRFAEQLNLTDSGKRCTDRVALAGIVKSWKYAGLGDAEMVSRAGEILGGMMEGMKANVSMKRKSSTMPIHDGIALNLTGGGLSRPTLAQRGAYVVINHHEGTGQSVVLTGRGSKARLDLNLMSEELPKEWFIHPSGFMVCYGSRKCRKDPNESGISLEMLCKRVHDWLIESLGYAPSEVIL